MIIFKPTTMAVMVAAPFRPPSPRIDSLMRTTTTHDNAAAAQRFFFHHQHARQHHLQPATPSTSSTARSSTSSTFALIMSRTITIFMQTTSNSTHTPSPFHIRIINFFSHTLARSHGLYEKRRKEREEKKGRGGGECVKKERYCGGL